MLIRLLFVLLLISSCSTQKRYDKSLKVVRGDFEQFRDACSISFPNVTTKHIQGETKTIYDTIYQQGEVIYVDNEKHVQCPPNKTIVKTEQRTDTIIKADTKELSKKESEIVRLTNDNNFYRELADAKQLEIDKLKDDIRDKSIKIANLRIGLFSVFALIIGIALLRIYLRK